MEKKQKTCQTRTRSIHGISILTLWLTCLACVDQSRSFMDPIYLCAHLGIVNNTELCMKQFVSGSFLSSFLAKNFTPIEWDASNRKRQLIFCFDYDHVWLCCCLVILNYCSMSVELENLSEPKQNAAHNVFGLCTTRLWTRLSSRSLTVTWSIWDAILFWDL